MHNGVLFFNEFRILPSTAWYQTKSSSTDTFVEVLRKEKIFLNVDSFEKNRESPSGVQRSLFSITGLHFRISDLTKVDLKKNFACEFPKIVENLLVEGLY